MLRSDNPFVDLVAKTPLSLPATDRLPAAGHLWSKAEIDALTFAWAARRPLLVRGEPGSGKSQIARAAAAVLGVAPLIEVIHPRFEAFDLLYSLDVVARLADAQIPKALDRTNARYLRKGVLWRAIERLGTGGHPVVLIDEIDKADSDLPNALLDVLGNRSFTVPHLKNRPTVSAPEGRLPFIVITTNEERELPPAFVRRCAVLNLNPPEDGLKGWLIKRGAVHPDLEVSDETRRSAAELVVGDRAAALQEGYPGVGLAEYIDLLSALHELTRHLPAAARADQEEAYLNRIAIYALKKYGAQPQPSDAETDRSG